MGNIISSYIFPHPPIIVPEVGRGNEIDAEETINAVVKASEEIGREKPTTIIVTTPHGPVFQDFIYISTDDRLSGSLAGFGAPQVKLEFENNTDLVDRIIKYSKAEKIFAGGIENHIMKRYKLTKELDHGCIVPLYFIDRVFKDFKIVHISIAGLPFLELYKFGMCISKAVEETGERVVFLASGDLSHRLLENSPAGFSPKGREFDELLVSSLRKADAESLLSIDESFCDIAGECGLRSFIMMFGALDGYELKPDIYSYEGPFGVGYSVGRFEVGDKNEERKVLEKVTKSNEAQMQEIREHEDPYVSLARKTLETYIKEGRIIEIPEDLPKELLNNKAGTFVSIKKNGQLRGCIGTTGPTRKNIAEEIIHNAISSGTRDPRFDPVEEDELQSLVYSVDVLHKPEPVKSINELDVVKYGVIVRSGSRSGLLLPNLEGVDSVEEQVSIALQKAGIRQSEKYDMERFEVVRHK